ncbi:hypothetical protein BKA81DRAFT_40109 [Phyllosticta paracitricarpa]
MQGDERRTFSQPCPFSRLSYLPLPDTHAPMYFLFIHPSFIHPSLIYPSIYPSIHPSHSCHAIPLRHASCVLAFPLHSFQLLCSYCRCRFLNPHTHLSQRKKRGPKTRGGEKGNQTVQCPCRERNDDEKIPRRRRQRRWRANVHASSQPSQWNQAERLQKRQTRGDKGNRCEGT